MLALLWQLLLLLPGILHLRTYVAEWGELKEESVLPAAILRHEYLYRSPGKFRFLAVAAEGSRVPKDELVAFLVSPEIEREAWLNLERKVNILRACHGKARRILLSLLPIWRRSTEFFPDY